MVFLLDELLRQEGITRDEYTQLNNVLAESLGSGIEGDDMDGESFKEEKNEDDSNDDDDDAEKSSGEKIKKLIQSTFEYSIQPDKKELLQLLNEFRKYVDEDVSRDAIQELEELIDIFLIDEFLDK